MKYVIEERRNEINGMLGMKIACMYVMCIEILFRYVTRIFDIYVRHDIMQDLFFSESSSNV